MNSSVGKKVGNELAEVNRFGRVLQQLTELGGCLQCFGLGPCFCGLPATNTGKVEEDLVARRRQETSGMREVNYELWIHNA